MKVLTTSSQMNKELVRLIDECSSCQLAFAWAATGFDAFDRLVAHSSKITRRPARRPPRASRWPDAKGIIPTELGKRPLGPLGIKWIIPGPLFIQAELTDMGPH